MFVLMTQNGQYYTGRAGEGWVSADKAEAFAYSEFGAACAKQETFNKRSSLTGLLFQVEAK